MCTANNLDPKRTGITLHTGEIGQLSQTASTAGLAEVGLSKTKDELSFFSREMIPLFPGFAFVLVLQN